MSSTRVSFNAVELDLLDDAMSYYRHVINDEVELDPDGIEWQEKQTANRTLSIKLERARRRVGL